MTDSGKLDGGSTGESSIASSLDNVVWHALTGPHAPLALGGAAARRYPVDIAPFCATRDPSEQSMHALARLTAGDPHVTLFTPERPVLTREFELAKSFTILQMIASSEVATSKDDRVSLLGAADDQEMTALAEETKPGPWRCRTHELGSFYGIRIGGELVAMAGERMQVPGASEISAVCTRDSHRGKGYAALVVDTVARSIRERGHLPFLHVFQSNRNAIALYEKLGFVVRRPLVCSVLRTA